MFPLFPITCQLPSAAVRRAEGCSAVLVPSALQHEDCVVCKHLYAPTLPAASCYRRNVGGVPQDAAALLSYAVGLSYREKTKQARAVVFSVYLFQMSS